jgi:hypothetical protein
MARMGCKKKVQLKQAFRWTKGPRYRYCMLRGPAEAGLQVGQGAQIQVLIRGPAEAGLQVDQGTQIQVLHA